MSETHRSERNTTQSPTSFSIESLEEIVRNCQRNEERLHELERHTRHERKKAERLLQQTYRTIHERDSQNTSVLETNTTIENSQIDDYQPRQQRSKEFFVSLDDEEEKEEYTNHHHRKNTNNNNKPQNQDKHLLERVEKLLAGDGTTTSYSDVMSSQEREKNIREKATSPIDDDLTEKFVQIDRKYQPETRQLSSACSIENDLSTVDRLSSERTPVNSQRIKSDIHLKHENPPKKTTIDYNEEKKKLSEQRDQLFYERLNNYVQTGRFASPETDKQTTMTTDEESYRPKSRPTTKHNSKDDELADLACRCEDLLARLHAQRNRAVILENSIHHYEYHPRPRQTSSSPYESQPYSRHRSHSPSPSPAPPPPMSLQQSLELLRPEFISRSRQRARRVRLLREEREHNAEIDRERREMLLFSCGTCCTNPPTRTVSATSSTSSSRRSVSFTVPYDRPNSSRLPLTYRQMKQQTKKKYDQLPEVKDRRLQNQMDEIRQRNLLRAKIFRARLRQHVRRGRTNIDESLSMIDT